MWKTKLAYNVWRRVGRKTESHNGEITVDGAYFHEGFGHTAYGAIMVEYPGWHLSGYSQIATWWDTQRRCSVCDVSLDALDSYLGTCKEHTE